MRGSLKLVTLCLAFVAVPSLGEEAVQLDDENARINYSVGYQVGGDFKRQGVALDPEQVAKGIEDALSGAEPLLTPLEMRKELAELQRKAMAERQARQQQLTEKQIQAGKEFLAANQTKEGVQVTESGLQYKVIQEGSGKSPAAQDKVRVNYRGTRVDGSEFDSSYKRGKSAEFRLDRVIKGWTEGLQIMKEGAKYEFYIPPELAYGERGRLAHQTLIFEVELLSVGESEKVEAETE